MRLVFLSNFGRGRGIGLSDSLAEDAFISLFVSSTLAVRSGIVPSLFVANGRLAVVDGGDGSKRAATKVATRCFARVAIFFRYLEQLGLRNENSKLLHELSICDVLTVPFSIGEASRVKIAILIADIGIRSSSTDRGCRCRLLSCEKEPTAVSVNPIPIATQATIACILRDRAKVVVRLAHVTTPIVLPICGFRKFGR